MDELTKAELDRLRDEEKRQNQRIGALEGRVEKLNEIALAIKELTINMGHMVEAQTKMQDDLEEIKQAPAQKWDRAVWIVVTAVLSALVGYAIKSVGI